MIGWIAIPGCIISHRCSWITVYVFWRNAQLNSSVPCHDSIVMRPQSCQLPDCNLFTQHVFFLWVNWIYAIVQFTDWRYAITKIEVGEMPLKLLYTSMYAITFIKENNDSKNTCIRVYSSVFTILPLFPAFWQHCTRAQTAKSSNFDQKIHLLRKIEKNYRKSQTVIWDYSSNIS